MKRLLSTLGMAAVLTAAGTTAALAAGPPYTVKVGPQATGTYAFSASAAIQTKIDFGSLHFQCNTLSSSGSVTAGLARNPVLTVSSTSFGLCGSAIGGMRITQTKPWTFRGTGSNATTGLEEIAGTADSFALRFVSEWYPNQCAFTVSGSPAAKLQESTSPQRIAISAPASARTLVVSDSNGCFGEIPNGARPDFLSALALSSPSGVINLS